MTYLVIDFVVHVAEVELERIGPDFILDRLANFIHASIRIVREPRKEGSLKRRRTIKFSFLYILPCSHKKLPAVTHM